MVTHSEGLIYEWLFVNDHQAVCNTKINSNDRDKIFKKKLLLWINSNTKTNLEKKKKNKDTNDLFFVAPSFLINSYIKFFIKIKLKQNFYSLFVLIFILFFGIYFGYSSRIYRCQENILLFFFLYFYFFNPLLSLSCFVYFTVIQLILW